MFRKLTVLGGIAGLIGGSVLVSTTAMAQIDATTHTIVCDTFSKATAGFKPSLTLGGTLPIEGIKIKGTLSGCVAAPNDVQVVSGSVSGLLTGGTNDCLALMGPSQAAGTITIKWKTVQKLTNAITTITVTAGDIVGGTSMPFGAAPNTSYGSFNISGTTQTGPFSGPGGMGANSFTKALTVQGTVNLGGQCLVPPSKGLKAVNFGPTEISLG